MRARLAGWLDVLGGASFALLPLVAPFLLGLRALLSGDRLSWAWLVPWAGMLAVGAVHAVAGHGPWLLVETAAAALACVALVPGSWRRLLAGLAVGLVAALAAALVERELTRSQWTPDPAEATVTDLVAGVSRVSGDRPTFRRNGLGLVEKRWSVPAGAESLELTFELRGLSGEPGWQWYTNSPRTRQERLEEDGAAFTRLTALDAYVVRRVRSDEPLAGRTVRVAVELRASEPTTVDGCALAVRTFEPSFSRCAPLELDADWRRVEVEATFPEDVAHGTFEVRLPELDVAHLDVRGLAVEALTPDGWRAAGVVEPAGVQVRFPQAGVHVFQQPTLNALPSAEWRSHSLSVPLAGDAREVVALLQVEAGLEVALRGVRLASADGGAARPAAGGRLDLWSGDPNLAGHGWAATGLAGQALAASPATSAGLLATTLALQLLAASRTATFAAAAFGAALLVLAARRRLRPALGVALVVVVVVALAFAGPRLASRLLVLTDTNTVTRAEIWSTATAALAAEPLAGFGGFPEAWRALRPGDARGAPAHAHDLWLELGATHGVPGLLAGAWLAAALLGLAWRWGRWRGVALAAAALAMNATDVTLTTAGALFPVAAALNRLRRDGGPPAPERD
ncbi:MAG TPA: O-antigen ligase family protein [Trueperaceae bacterium]|nr:O-antigen ligase family protein [Trueperaceae bacterium]